MGMASVGMAFVQLAVIQDSSFHPNFPAAMLPLSSRETCQPCILAEASEELHR